MYCQGPNPCQGHMISRGPTSAHKTLYFLCSLDLFLFPSPVLRYLFNSLSIGMRLSSLTGGNHQNKLQPLHFEFLSHHCHHTFLASLPPPVTSTFVAGIGIALVWITRLQLKISPLSN